MSLTLIAYDPVAQGAPYLAALGDAGVLATITPAGLMVSDAVKAAAVAGDATAILSQAQMLAMARVDALVIQKIAAGWTYQGASYQIDTDSQAQISAIGALASAVLAKVTGALWPSGFVWVDAANLPHPMSAAEMFAFAQGAAMYVSGLILNGRALKDQIQAAETLSAVQAVDLATGWPLN